MRSRAAAGDQNVCGRGGQGDHGPARSTRRQLSATNIATTAVLDLLGQELRHDEVVKERLRAALSCFDEEAEGIKPPPPLLVLGPNKRLAVYPKRQDDRGIGRGDALDSQLVLLGDPTASTPSPEDSRSLKSSPRNAAMK